ncbi:hypothetical protein IIY68_00700 [Candidatus Saccharibacteria bacterium]|nr:hypothetical protein [Candidatus Saccharibacteria bacterium]
MEEIPKNHEENVGVNGAEILSEMPPFGERETIGEKYYTQAQAELERWVERSQKELEQWENLSFEGRQIGEWRKNEDGKKRLVYRPLDKNNPGDVRAFNEYKADKIESARRHIQEDEQYRSDDEVISKLAKSFKNQEMIDQIATKLKSGEDFTDEENEFLGDYPDFELFDTDKFMTPDALDIIYHNIMGIPSYSELLDQDDEEATIWPSWTTVAKAQMREAIKKNKILLHNSEEVRRSLERLEKRTKDDLFAGETTINSESGEARTFTLEDNYPKLEVESEEE